MAAADPEHGNQAASNAILGAIAANDALCIYLGGDQPSGESHLEATDALTQACRGTRWEREVRGRARQLEALIRMKAAAQYSGRRLSVPEVSRILRQAERFIDWAEAVRTTAPSG
ncbi:MAG: hypothetical protein FJX75_21415 [Armatimonadetes bacterium]|nr:hypothetical protein [Armatimonadota bacterium]